MTARRSSPPLDHVSNSKSKLCLQNIIGYNYIEITHPFAIELFFDLRILEVRAKIYANRCIAEYGTCRIVGSLENVDECFALGFAVLEEQYTALGRCLKGFQSIIDAILVFVVEMAFEFDEWLNITKKKS